MKKVGGWSNRSNWLLTTLRWSWSSTVRISSGKDIGSSLAHWPVSDRNWIALEVQFVDIVSSNAWLLEWSFKGLLSGKLWPFDTRIVSSGLACHWWSWRLLWQELSILDYRWALIVWGVVDAVLEWRPSNRQLRRIHLRWSWWQVGMHRRLLSLDWLLWITRNLRFLHVDWLMILRLRLCC